jgi:hypothetical protein
VDVRPAPRAGSSWRRAIGFSFQRIDRETLTASPASQKPARSIGRLWWAGHDGGFEWCPACSTRCRIWAASLPPGARHPDGGRHGRIAAPGQCTVRPLPARPAWRSASWAPTFWSRPTA